MTVNYTTPDTRSYPRTLRTTLPDPFYTGGTTDSDEISTGVFLTALYWQPRARRLIARTYSIWATKTGEHVGERYTEACMTQYGRLALHHWSISEYFDKIGLTNWALNYV